MLMPKLKRIRDPSLDGTGGQLCKVKSCGRWSLSHLPPGKGLCPFHAMAEEEGEGWAKAMFSNYKPRVTPPPQRKNS